MPIVATVSILGEELKYQWFSDNGKVRHEGAIKWSEIQSVDAFKRDLFSYDLICLEIRGADSENESLEIDEEDLNWEALMTGFSTHLSGITPWSEWYPDVMLPAFAANRRRIYQRDS